MLLVQAPPPSAEVQVVPPGALEAFNPKNPVEARLSALAERQDWQGLCDAFETQPVEVGFRFRGTWVEALGKAQRWEQLQQLCGLLAKNPNLARDPRRPVFLQQRARALSQLQRHAEAAPAWEAFGQAGGGVPGFQNACAEARLVPDWGALERYADALLRLRPEDSEALGWKGEALARQDRFTESDPLLRRAVAANPRLSYAWNNLGRGALERKAWGEAKEALDKALALDPGQLEALFNRGRAHFELKQYAASRDDFKAALALQPDNPVLAENLRQAERYAALKPPTKASRR